MLVSLIVAMDRNRLIGNANTLPWHLPADLKRFKSITMGKPIIMGRNTFESIGKPLPGRRNIVLTRNADYSAPGCELAADLAAAYALCAGVDEVIVIGGMQIYLAALPQVQRMYLTLIDHAFSGDAWFPAFNMQQWCEVHDEVHCHESEQENFSYRFVTLERIEGE